MSSRRRVIPLATVLMGGFAGCSAVSEESPLGIFDQVDIDNGTSKEYTAIVLVRDDDETMYDRGVHIDSSIREGVEISSHEPGEYVVEAAIGELSTTRNMNVSEYVSEDRP